MACLTWFTKKYTPYVGGSGIPQVIASINLPHSSYKTKLVEFSQTIWKIPLTFLAMLIGVSVGRISYWFYSCRDSRNSPYFPRYQGATSVSCLYLWLAICGVGYGILGGIFGRLLAKGIAGLSPEKWRGWVRQHPIYIALLLGLVLAALLEWK
ncbi:chloride channel protein [Haemophilus influenzae]|uniref:chloride channel protein n=1 Tax=Haemophilus influenzae TaxID=727 RepID=UPI0024A906FF|nr:chloride channel protein [Haemophilus influenzae]